MIDERYCRLCSTKGEPPMFHNITGWKIVSGGWAKGVGKRLPLIVIAPDGTAHAVLTERASATRRRRWEATQQTFINPQPPDTGKEDSNDAQ